MADELVEIYKGNHEITELADGILAITGAVGESYVIKNIYLNYPNGTFDITLTVDGYEVVDYSAGTATSEIVQANVNVTLNLSPPSSNEYSDLDLMFVGASNKINTWTSQQRSLLSGSLYESEIKSSTSGTNVDGGFATENVCGVLSSDGAYYTLGSWDGNFASYLYKMQSDTGAIHRNISLNGYTGMPRYGGDGYFYYRNAGLNTYISRMSVEDTSDQDEYYIYHATGGTMSTYPLFATNSQPSPDGKRSFIFCNATGTSVYLRQYNQGDTPGSGYGTKTIGTAGTGFWANWTAGAYVEPFYDVGQGIWKILYQSGAATSIKIGNMPTSSVEPNGVSTASTIGNSSDYPVYANGKIYGISTGGEHLWRFSSSLTSQVNHDQTAVWADTSTYRPVPTIRTTVPDAGTIAGRTYVNATTHKSVNIRITGIKSTA